MRDQIRATTANDFATQPREGRPMSRLVQTAPGPELPDTRDKAGAQTGMAIMLVGGVLFWLIVAALVIFLLR